MKKLASVISTAILIFLIAAAMLVAVPRLFGMKMYTVLSGSMENTLSVGDLIYVQPTDPKLIKEGDIISFVLNEDLVVATHRVVAADRVSERFTTKGDANSAPDASLVLYGNVIGVEKFSIPRVGFLFNSINTTSGRIIAVTVIALLAVVSFVLSDSKKKTASSGKNETPDKTETASPCQKDKSNF